MTWYPRDPTRGRGLQTGTPGFYIQDGIIAHLHLTGDLAPAASTTGVLAAVEDTGEDQEIDEGFTNPPYPRNITATAGGTAGDIKAIQVIVEGTDIAGNEITETLPAFTANSAGTVSGSKAFATVTKVTIPAHDDTGATTAIGWGDLFGLPDTLPGNTTLFAVAGASRTTPSMTTDADDLAKNTFEFTGANGSTDFHLYYIV